jgi:hypothetical protein
MRSIYIVCAFILLTGMPSCKQDTASVQESAGQPAQAPSAEASAQAPADQAASDAALTNGHDYTFLTDKLFHYQAAFGGQKGGEQPYKDEWIDFDPDGTFKAGKLKEQTHTGKWGYNHDTKTLFLRPDVTTYKMSEWKVMFNDQMMVWVGTNTYGDNPIQIKLVRKTELP